MTTTVVNQDDTDVIKNDPFAGNNAIDDQARWLRYNVLVKTGRIVKNFMKDGIKLSIQPDKITDADWDIILEEICNKKRPLRELIMRWSSSKDETVESGFIKLTNAIGTHTTLVNFQTDFTQISVDNKLSLVLRALKDNRSIQHLHISSNDFNLEIASRFAQALLNNQTLLSLNINANDCVKREYDEDTDSSFLNFLPLAVESVGELARSFYTTTLERLYIRYINNEGFQLLAQSLPKTLIHFDLTENKISADAIPMIRSYLKSNGSTLKELILDDTLAEEYLEQQGASLVSKVEIFGKISWKNKVSNNNEPINITPTRMDDTDWSAIFMELNKDINTGREIELNLWSELDEHQLNHVETLLGEQFRFTSLIIVDCMLYAPISVIELLQKLKKNVSLAKLQLRVEMKTIVFRELLNLLTIKNNITHLILSHGSSVKDEDAIMLADLLKNNTVLQNFTLENSQIGNTALQALLSSLPHSLIQLSISDELINREILPYLLAFIKIHPLLEEVSLTQISIGMNITGSTEVNITYTIAQILKITDENHCYCELDFKDTMKEYVSELTDGVISLCDKNLEDDHVLELCNELKKEPRRSWSLDLTSNERISPVGYSYLADILSSTIVIETLKVNYMNEEAQANLLQGLSKNMTLSKLSIKSKLNNKDMEYIGRFVQNNRALKQLNLNECEIDDDGVIHLSKGLAENSLESLELDQNTIGDRGFASLLSSVPATLKTLLLIRNQITESSLQTIFTFLATNRTLEILAIQGNSVCGENYWDPDGDFRQQASKVNTTCELN